MPEDLSLSEEAETISGSECDATISGLNETSPLFEEEDHSGAKKPIIVFPKPVKSTGYGDSGDSIRPLEQARLRKKTPQLGTLA